MLPTRSIFAVAVIGIVLFVAHVSPAGDHWLSSGGRSPSAGQSGNNRGGGERDLPRDPRRYAMSPIDIVISLHADPKEPHERAPYYRIIEHFADAIYEATNGAHQIRTVSIYTNYRFAPRADIVWGDTGWPTAMANGIGIRGQHIYMFDEFNGTRFLESAQDQTKGGYILAHNWAHYAYGLYDEHVGLPAASPPDDSMPQVGDIAVEPSIMNDPMRAAVLTGESRLKWLNFSSRTDSPPGEFGNTQATAQHRMHGVSGWETLTRLPDEDQRNGRLVSSPDRVFWRDLMGAAPESDERWIKNLPNSRARRELEIVWLKSEVVYEIVLDRSGSMGSEDKLENAKTGVGWLVDRMPIGSSVGIVQYNQIAEVVLPITTIESREDRVRIKDVIAQLRARGMTAIGLAAQAALDEITASPAETSNRVVFLLSDGRHNTGFHPFDMIPAYQEAEIPIFTFGYGSDADEDLLRRLAEETGGRYYHSPTTLPDITSVFADANRQVAPVVAIASANPTISPGGTETKDFAVDSSFSDLGVVVSYLGSPGEAQIGLYLPDGALASGGEVIQSGSSTQVRFNIDDPNDGFWRLEMRSLAHQPLDVGYIIEAAPSNDVTYSVSLTNLTGDTVEYPQPMVLLAVMENTRPITGLQVTGAVEAPDGSIASIDFRDDGQSPDAIAGDGRYSATYLYRNNGKHTVTVQMDNRAGVAQLSTAGLAPIDDAGPPPTEEPIHEDFERWAVLQVDVSGVVDDDHGDVPDNATLITANNADKAGRIDAAGDVDVFRIAAPTGASTLIIRISDMSAGMAARLSVLARDGTTELASGTVSANDAIVVDAPVGTGSILFAVISHVEADGLGSYNISAGVAEGFAPDGDGDGVPDDFDLCPDTLPADEPDSMGCSVVQQDLDGDGVSIDLDDCPDTRFGERVKANGCSVTQIDNDADGVADIFDRCLGTPSDQDADEHGCSDWQLADADDDGVANYRDECPQTAPGEVPDRFGCSCSEFDDDSDGVVNCEDFCPESPAGDQIDANGCACGQLDEDGDDVSNCDDQCPGTIIGLRVDEFGCSASDDPRAVDATLTAPLPSACGALGMINLMLMLSGLSLLSRPFRRYTP